MKNGEGVKDIDWERLLLEGCGALYSSMALIPAIYNQKWRKSLAERFGGGEWQKEKKCLRECLWFHAASVGEVTGIVPLLRQLREKNQSLKVTLTSTSVTGRQHGIEQRISDFSALLPFDCFLWLNRGFADFSPRALIITETEIWPNMLHWVSRKGVPAAVINGRISDYSYPGYRRLLPLLKSSFSSLKFVAVQTSVDAERFCSLGVAEKSVFVCGSTKYDRDVVALSNDERLSLANELGLELDRPCFVAGSVRKDEDQAVIAGYMKAKSEHPGLQMIIAPRHPERFQAVADLLVRSGLSFNRRSLGAVKRREDILLLDTLGELGKLYSLGSLSFVGGSMVNVGGHNPLEPAAYRQPVLFGPFTSTVREASAELVKSGGGFIVKNEQELAERLVFLFNHPPVMTHSAEAAFQVWQTNRGAIDRVIRLIEGL